MDTFNFPTKIHVGAGVRHELAATLQALGIHRPLLLTDQGIAGLPWWAEVQSLTGDAPTASFTGVVGNPVVSQVKAGVAAFTAHDADGIVAVGGGAPIDVAKAVALMAHHPGELLDYEDGKSGARPIDQAIPPIVAIPTTAGTGSEVGRSAVVSDDETHAKKIIFDPQLLPRVVLADPELTLGLPSKITAATGMDALTHLVEAFLARGYHPMADGIALEGIGLVARHLVSAVGHARAREAGESVDTSAHVEARGQMLVAAMMGAVAFQKGLGVTHSCAHALSTVCDTHHGLANGVMLPAALRFNLVTEGVRFLRLARAVDPGAQDGADFIDWVIALRSRVGIPPALGDLGVTEGHLDRLVAVAIDDGCHPLNPRPVTRDDFFAIYRDAL
jgi:hypothetical protein